MAVDLARYVVSLEAQSAKYVQELDKANKKLDRFHRDQQRAVAGIKRAFLNIGTSLAAAFSVRAIAQFTAQSIRAADAIGETARAAGFSAERFQRLQYVFRQNGVDANEFDAAMRSLNTRLGQFITTGAGPAAKALEQLGLKQRILSGEIGDSQQAFDAIVEELGAVQGSAQRAAIAAALFGREAGAKMQQQLGVGIEAMNRAAEAATGVFTDETVSKADSLADAWDRIAAATGNFASSAAIAATYDLAKLFGIDEASAGLQALQIQLAELRQERDTIAAQRAVGIGTVRSVESIDKQIALIEQQLEYERLIKTPFVTAPSTPTGLRSDGRKIESLDGLEEISTSFGRLPAGVKQFDAAGAAAAILNMELQEVSGTLVKMPDDLKKLPPEFNNAVAALRRYDDALDEADKRQQELAESMGRAFGDAFTGWILGAERNFSDFLKRMAVQLATSAIFKGLSGLFPGGSFFSNFFGGFRAEGGPVSAGKGYVVGERGPELFFPGQSGMVAANGGGGSISIVNHIDARGADPSLITRLPAILEQNNRRLKAELKFERNRGR